MTKIWKFGNDVDTDVIIPARYLNTSEPSELAKHCFEDINPQFASGVKTGDIVVAGENFGCGSSREHAPIAIKASGIEFVVAKSFARIFYRNAINTGLTIIEQKDFSDECGENDRIELDTTNGILKNLTLKKEYEIQKFPDGIQKIIDAGGLTAYTAQKIGENK